MTKTSMIVNVSFGGFCDGHPLCVQKVRHVDAAHALDALDALGALVVLCAAA